MSTCWTCAKFYDPKATTSPLHYCSSACYDYGSRPYNQPRLRQISQDEQIRNFAVHVIDKLHYLSHNNDDRYDCEWELCVTAKILGL